MIGSIGVPNVKLAFEPFPHRLAHRRRQSAIEFGTPEEGRNMRGEIGTEIRCDLVVVVDIPGLCVPINRANTATEETTWAPCTSSRRI